MMRAGLLIAALALSACAAAPAPDPWMTGVKFAPMAYAEKAEATYVQGSGGAGGLYTVRVHVAPGGRIAPHTHPDDRILTVVSGEVWYGFGTTPDKAQAKLYRAGDVFRVPANQPHYAFADSDVVYQEAGMGPTAFTPVK